MKARSIAALVVALVLALGVPAVAVAGPGKQDGGVRFGSFTLEAGDTWHGDLVVVGGPLSIEADATVDGDAVVVGGDAEVAGTIEGDLVVIGGLADLKFTSVVGSDLVLLGSTVDRAPGARIGGKIEDPLEDFDLQGFEFDRVNFGRFDFGRSFPFFLGGEREPGGVLVDSILGLVSALTLVVSTIAIGLVLVAILPDHLTRVADSLRAAPLLTLGVGLVTLFGSLLAILLLVVTICGIPLAFLGALALAVAGVVGWVSLGYLVGQRLLEEGGAKKAGPVPAVVAGVLLITLISAAPFGLGTLFKVVGGAWGLGAVALTRFGTRIYPEGAD
ncbi:MAG: hypothetical protein ACE5NC_04205 [Anaerolineae bacterium]